MKRTKELNYVHYLLRVIGKSTEAWSSSILKTIQKRLLDKGNKYDGNYTPLYLDDHGKEVEMQRNSAVI